LKTLIILLMFDSLIYHNYPVQAHESRGQANTNCLYPLSLPLTQGTSVSHHLSKVHNWIRIPSFSPANYYRQNMQGMDVKKSKAQLVRDAATTLWKHRGST